MEPIRYVDALIKKYGEMGFPPYEWSRYDDAPITPLGKPLSQCTVSMLTSGGVSRRGMQPFNPEARNDLRLDSIAPDAPSDDFQIHDSYYDHTDASRDLNCIFPIDRLRELAATGEIGAVAPRLWSGFMGRIYKRQAVLQDKAPALAEALRQDGVDLFIAVPACPLDHQTVGLVCRVIEEAGIPTVCVSTGRDITALVRPPRSYFVNAPMGNTFGAAGDVAAQRRILRAALALAAEANAAGRIVDDPMQWPRPFAFNPPPPTPEAREKQLRK